MKKIAVVAINKNGREIAKTLKRGFSEEALHCFGPSAGELKDLVGGIFDKDKFEGIIFIMALGIVVRLIAPHLKSKYNDPAVVVIDDFARYCISALSGHEGGANGLALQAGNILDAEPVITTASEALKDVVIGIGCRKGINKEAVLSGIKKVLAKAKCPLKRVRCLATIDLKAKEKGLLSAAEDLRIPLRIVSRERVRNYQGEYKKSDLVYRKIGIGGVCEPCALIVGTGAKIILPKLKLDGLTISIVRES
jgi:cobalt-precorrin 5A hydrolase